jgi:hypothetical protein
VGLNEPLQRRRRIGRIRGELTLMLLSEKKARATADKAANTPKRPKWFAQIRWNHQNREARRAHVLVAAALKAGTLKKGHCEVCRSLRTEAHHDDYSQPLVVRWFCRGDHRRYHAAERRQQKVLGDGK